MNRRYALKIQTTRNTVLILDLIIIKITEIFSMYLLNLMLKK